MKLAFLIHTPGQVHFWSHILLTLEYKGHKIIVVARGEESICHLLNKYGVQYITYGKSSKTRYGKVLQLPFQFFKSFNPVVKFRPDILLGTGPMEAYLAAFLRKPCFIFDDNESRHFFDRYSWSYAATVILTPSCFRRYLGKKQVRFGGYKELAYLHPNQFTPDPAIFDELGIKKDEHYVILRFSAFDAVHDIGRKGFSLHHKRRLVEKIGGHSRVFISSEKALPGDLEPYSIPILPSRIHHALAYAKLLVCDTGTMAWEAAVLGTPAIACGSFTAQFGNFVELEKEYDLLYSFSEPEAALKKAMDLIIQTDLKEQWAKKRQRLLADKIDVTRFMVDFIENYPQSFEECRRNQGKAGR